MSTLLTRLVGGSPALVAFDLDGTLVDSVPDIALAVDQMRTALNRPVAGVDAVRDWVGNGAEMLVKRALADSSDPQRVAQVSKAQLDEAFPLFRSFYGKCNGKASQLYDGATACLQGLHDLGVPLAIVTNKPKMFTDPLLKSLGIAAFFQEVIGGECFPEKKPSPVALNYLADKYQAKPDTCLMVGDSKYDVGAARAAGYKALAVTYGYNHGEPVSQINPDAVVDNLAELVATAA
ncbi:MAG: phosphoglycolate phosphatase [Gammaproteobacteria bacterium]|nr:MAG: phosphoglycolate phosphatase [Gammaproteobacteria bacterium]